LKRKHQADTDELNRRLRDLGQLNSQLNAQGLQEANKLRDLNAHLAEQLRESEQRYRESASKQLSDFEGVRVKCHEEVSHLKQQLELAQRVEVDVRRAHSTVVTDLTLEREGSKQQLELLQRRFNQLTESNRRLSQSATVASDDDDRRVASLGVALEVAQKQLDETTTNLGKVQSELLDTRLRLRATDLELAQARSQVAAAQSVCDDSQKWANKVQSRATDLSCSQMESASTESLLWELRAQPRRSRLEMESLQSKLRAVGSDTDQVVALQSQLAP
jgi:hypothetical protein